MALINSFWYELPSPIWACSFSIVYVGGFLETTLIISETSSAIYSVQTLLKEKSHREMQTLSPILNMSFYILVMACCTEWTKNRDPTHSMVLSLLKIFFLISGLWRIKTIRECTDVCDLPSSWREKNLYDRNVRSAKAALVSLIVEQICILLPLQIASKLPAMSVPLYTQIFSGRFFSVFIDEKVRRESLESVFILFAFTGPSNRFWQTSEHFTPLLLSASFLMNARFRH